MNCLCIFDCENHNLSRRSVSKYWGMDKMLGSMASVLLVGLGGLVLYRLLQRLRLKACMQDAVVVITGASSGLGKGANSHHT